MTKTADHIGDRFAATDPIFEKTVEALSACADDALSLAACGGLVDPVDVIDWVVRAKRLVLYQRNREAVRSEVLQLADGLGTLLDKLELPVELESEAIARSFIERLPSIRARLAEDVRAAFEGDPAATSYDEIVVAYPSIRALAVYRIAHELYGLAVPLLPRVMTEYAHDRTGIDIHPGAKLGRRFFIDHGTGVVIGETAVVGDGVRLYQGVTLGATSIRNSSSLRGSKRHPTVEDDVTIYAGAKILGGDTVIGAGSVIGGNVWLTESVPPGSRVIAEPGRHLMRQALTDEAVESAPLQLQWDI